MLAVRRQTDGTNRNRNEHIRLRRHDPGGTHVDVGLLLHAWTRAAELDLLWVPARKRPQAGRAAVRHALNSDLTDFGSVGFAKQRQDGPEAACWDCGKAKLMK